MATPLIFPLPCSQLPLASSVRFIIITIAVLFAVGAGTLVLQDVAARAQRISDESGCVIRGQLPSAGTRCASDC